MTQYVCAADLGLRSDGTGAVVLRVEHETKDVGEGPELIAYCSVAAWLERKPKPGAPLTPSVLIAEIATLARRFHVGEVWADQFYVESFREGLGTRGISLREAPAGNTGKTLVWSAFRESVHEGRTRLPRIPGLLTQIGQVRSKPMPGGGMSIQQPRSKGSHGDLAAALALAVWAAGSSQLGLTEFTFDSLPDTRHAAVTVRPAWHTSVLAPSDDDDWNTPSDGVHRYF